MVRSILLAFVALVITLIVGIVGLILTEHLTLGQAIYLSVQTVTTVGYGDIQAQTDEGHIFLVFLMLSGVGVIAYFTGLLMSFIIEGHLAGAYWRRKMNKKIERLQNHIIVCGAGRVGKQVVYRLRKEGVDCVVIEQREDLANQLIEEGFLVIHSDATRDETLNKASINMARGLISALPEDSLNVFVTLTAKGLNPSIQVVARMDQPESEKKLLRAGADKVISPATLSGFRMAMSILKPNSVEYLETVIHHQNIEIEMVDLKIDQGSCLVGETLLTSGIKQQTGAMVLAILRDNQVISNPDAREELMRGDLLIVLGLRDQLHRLEELAANLTNCKSLQT